MMFVYDLYLEGLEVSSYELDFEIIYAFINGEITAAVFAQDFTVLAKS